MKTPLQSIKKKATFPRVITSDYTINPLCDNGCVFLNQGASGEVNVYLPDAKPNQVYKFQTVAAQKVVIRPQASDDIQDASVAVLTDGYYVYTAGTGNEYLVLECRLDGHWIVTKKFGALTALTAIPAGANGLTIAGCTAPVTGATPVSTITASTIRTGTVTWAPEVATVFLTGTVYTATITITPLTGFTLTGVAQNTFVVTGAASDANAANSGTVTAVFAETV